MKLKAALALPVLFAASLNAYASERDALAYRLMVEAGQVIASQGNAALTEMKAELTRSLKARFAMGLASDATPPDSVSELVDLHRDARSAQ